MIRPNISIDSNKHVGIIFQPRSGSHVVREFLAKSSNRPDLAELFNFNVNQIPINIINGELMRFPERRKGDISTKSDEEQWQESLSSLDKLSQLTDLTIKTVFSIFVSGYCHIRPEISDMLASRDDIQYINLQRADVLSSLLSILVARNTNVWHNTTGVWNDTTGEHPLAINFKYEYPLNQLKLDLIDYINEQDVIKEHFGELPKLYYEEFQDNVGNLRNIFTGIPKKIISTSFSKVGGNNKERITNLKEVEDCYEQFVNEHRDYFPQYFNKLPYVVIPTHQGNQPRDLSK